MTGQARQGTRHPTPGLPPTLARRLDKLRVLADELLGQLAAEQKRITFTGEFERRVFAVAISNARVCADACGLLSEVARRRDE